MATPVPSSDLPADIVPADDIPEAFRKVGNAAMQGYMQGGIVPAAIHAGGAGMENLSNAVNSLAYKAGGAVSEGATKLGLPPEVAGGAGYAANVATQAIPALAGGGIGSKLGSLGQMAGQRLMQSALKPSAQAMLSGKGERAIQTMLDQGANVTSGGIAKLIKREAVLAEQEKAALSQSKALLSKNDVARGIADTEKKFATQVNPSSDVAAIQASKQEFLDNPLLMQRGKSSDEIPIQLAQELKQGTYRTLGDKAYTGELKSADAEAQKALARQLRLAIEKEVPAVAPINAERSDLVNAIKIASQRNAVAGNKNPSGGFPLLAYSPKAALAMMADRSEVVKSMLARLLYRGSKPVGTAAGATLGAALVNQEEQP